jgi:site-specific DNA-methyltransferase (adenine-specific)
MDSDYSLLRGDCLNKMGFLDEGTVDMVLVDLPYGTTACKWDTIIPLEPLWTELKRLAKPTAAMVFTASQPFTTALIASNLKEFRYCWVWDKQVGRGHLVAKKRPMAKHEDIAVFYRKPPIYVPQMTLKLKPEKGRAMEHSRTQICGGRITGRQESVIRTHSYPTTIISIPSDPNKGKLHPTQKPVALMEYLIRTYTREGDTVLDCCMGSGSTGVAAIRTGRKFIGIEKDEAYYDAASQRIQDAYISKGA